MNRFECFALPMGWLREEVPSSKGLSSGRKDVIYYSPTGKKVRNKQELNKILGDTYELGNFDFRTGQIIDKPSKPKKDRLYDGIIENIKSDVDLVAPIRQTASIFKQPVTVLKKQPSQVKSDLQPRGEKPRQLFWEKRLTGIAAYCPSDENFKINLPSSIKSAGFSDGMEETILLASISTALHMSSQPITGQIGKQEVIETNPGLFINPKQPLMANIEVSQEDISDQEERVSVARQKLADALDDVQAKVTDAMDETDHMHSRSPVIY